MTAANPAAPENLAQPVLSPPAKAAIFLTLTVRAGSEDAVREALSGVPGLIRSIAFRVPENQLTCVTGIGARLWDRMYDLPRPAGLHPFRPLAGDAHSAPSTPGDLFFHIRAQSTDMCFELARRITLSMSGHADVEDEVHAFRYWDDRNLLGFVDGSENPDNPAEQITTALLGPGSAFPGGSYVITQKYLHDLQAWEELTVEQQQLVIGRSKLENIELDEDVQPADSHVAVNIIEGEDGEELSIVRGNMPFGTIGSGEFGTYFIGYAADPAPIETMLEHMFLGEPRGTHDRLLDFSEARTGCLYFVPPAAFLTDPGSFADPGTAPSGPVTQPAASADGSLRIGSLKRSTQ